MLRRHFSPTFSYLFLVLWPVFGLVHLDAKAIPQQIPTGNHKQGRHTSRQVPDLTIHEKEWNILIDIAGNNNLHRFVEASLKQMEMIGSNSNINIICQVDRFGNERLQRVEVHKGVTQTVWSAPARRTDEYKKTPRTYMSGTRESVESFLEWAIKRYPARKQFVVFWNHGSGFVDPTNWGRLITNLHQDFFAIDPVTGMQKLNRDSLLTEELEGKKKGLQFNDISGTYLTTNDLSDSLSTISTRCLGGRPFDIIGMDACCMAGIEIASQLKHVASHLIFSQEVELGAGWNYSYALKKASEKPISALEFAKEVVTSYEHAYSCITPDYTLSVLDFTAKTTTGQRAFDALEQKIGELALFLIPLLSQNKKAVSKLAEIRRKSHYSTWFYDNNYIDLHHFLTSIQTELRKALEKQEDKDRLMRLAADARTLLQQSVPFFTAGTSFGVKPAIRARGLSIYFPLKSIHPSYRPIRFSSQESTKAWANMLALFLVCRDVPSET